MTSPEPPDSSAINKLLWLADRAMEQGQVAEEPEPARPDEEPT